MEQALAGHSRTQPGSPSLNWRLLRTGTLTVTARVPAIARSALNGRDAAPINLIFKDFAKKVLQSSDEQAKISNY